MSVPGRLGRRPFHGWRMVGVAFLTDFVAVGFFFYSYGVFFKALTVDFGGSRLGVSLGLTASSVVSALAAPFLGRALDRLSIRRIMLAGGLATACGFALISWIGELWQLYVLLATLIPLGTLAMGNLSAATLVANWFVARRGTALGIATMGISLSGLLMPPVATWLIDQVGWRGGFRVYAIATLLLVLPVVAALVVNRPEDVGQRPDGAAPEPTEGSEPPAPEPVHRTRELLRNRNFWAIALPFALSFGSLSAILIHLVPHATDLGIEPYRASAVLSLAAGMGVIGKFVFGALVDRLDARVAVGASFGTQLIGLLMLMASASPASLAVAALVFGFGMGGTVPLQGAVIGLAFGRLSYGKAVGLMRPVQLPIHALGVPAAGWIFDSTGSYRGAFLLFVALYLLAIALLATLRVGPAPRAPGPARADTGPTAQRR